MADLAKIREAIAANIRAAFPDVNVTGYNLPLAMAPAFEVEVDRIVYDAANARGLDEWFFTVRGFAASGLDKAAQMRLDPWLSSTGSQSVKTALEADSTLGGNVSDVRVVGLAKIAVFSQDKGVTNFFGAEWTLRVLVPGV